MTDTTMSLDSHAPAGPARDAPLAAVLESLTGLVRSAEPAVVFASLVRLCVPSICDAATATILGADQNVYAVSWPREALKQPRSRRGVVATEFEAPAWAGHPGYHGVLSLRFDSQDRCHAFVAQLMVERAMATVEREQLMELANKRASEAENLELALTSNREISVAIGILMVKHALTSEQALEVLRTTSQASNQKLRAIAVEITRTGVINLPPAKRGQKGRA
jgi:hypothetical protein